MNVHEYIRQLENVCGDGGDSCDAGCSRTNLPKMMALARKKFPGKPICVVSGWKWLVVNDLNGDGKAPEEDSVFSMVYGDVVEHDDACRGFRSVRSSPLVDFQDNCLFCTANTIYLLVGTGKKSFVSWDVISSIYFSD